MFDLYAELTSVVDALDRSGVPYALCGGLALAVHGHPRATVDIDLLVEPQSMDRFSRAVEPLGFTFHARPMILSDGKVEIRRVTKIADGDPLMLDVILVGPATERAWASRETFEIGGRRLTVVSPEGLIALKELRGSEQDRADIAKLEGRE